MNQIETLFDRMDEWRHLPSYQLERRADLFFSLYLAEVLEAKLGFPIREQIVPEFPVRIGTIYPDIPIHKSFKIDYLAVSVDGATGVFVELKTDGMSRRDSQDKYLTAAKDVGPSALLDGVLEIFRATQAKRKYFHLLQHLEMMGLFRIPERMRQIMSREGLRGAEEASCEIEITTRAAKSTIVYVQPIGEGEDVVSFWDFRGVVLRHQDPVSERFAESLSRWATTTAGGRARFALHGPSRDERAKDRGRSFAQPAERLHVWGNRGSWASGPEWARSAGEAPSIKADGRSASSSRAAASTPQGMSSISAA